MSDLFAWFQSYLNLAKITAVTLPGMVVAFALILVLGPVPCTDSSKTCPFCSSTLKPVTPSMDTASGPLSVSPKTLIFVNDANGPQTLTIKNTGPLPITDIRVLPLAENADHFRIVYPDPAKATRFKPLASGAQCIIGITVTSPSSHWLRPDSVPSLTSSLWITGTTSPPDPPTGDGSNATKPPVVEKPETKSKDAPTPPPPSCWIQNASSNNKTQKDVPALPGVNQLVGATAQLVWGPDLPSVSNVSDPSKQKNKTVSNTVVTSSATWLSAGTASTFAANQDSSSKAASDSASGAGQKPAPSPVPPPSRESLLGKFESLVPPPFQKKHPNDLSSLNEYCGKMPLYVLPNSRPSSDKSDAKAGESSKPKAGTPEYTEETVRSVEEILSTSDYCYGDLTKLDEDLQADIASLQTTIAQGTTDLTGFSSNLVSAQNGGDTLVAHDLSARVRQKKEELRAAQQDLKSLSQAESYVASLVGLVSTNRNAALTQAASVPPPPAAPSNPVIDVFQTIQQNFLKFLLFSLIVGQILDPIQRGLVSLAGPRRTIFEHFNLIYGRQGDGEFRYGDRRLPPWTDPVTSPDPRLAKWLNQEAQKRQDKEEKTQTETLPPVAADFEFRRNMNIYDADYAIGAGFITQNEFNSIYNEYFTQSQLTSGLIIPLAVLSLCTGIRVICCASPVISGGTAWFLTLPIIGAIYLGVVSGYGISLVISYLGSRKYRSIFWDFMHDLRNGRPIEERTRFCFIIGFVVLLGIFLIFSMIANDDILRWDVLATVAIPCLFLCPLWIGGLDRLHKFYSELQARIGGNILRLQQTTQQQMVDLITQSDSRKSLKKNLRNALASNQQLFDFLEKFFPQDDKGPGPTSPPDGGN